MKKSILFFAVIILLFTSCKGNEPNEPNEPVVKNEVKVTVYDTTTWSVANPVMAVVESATVTLSSKLSTSEGKTNKDGVVVFKDVKEAGYSIYAKKDNLSNLLNETMKDGYLQGYLIVGVYENQEDIDSSAEYSQAIIGKPKPYDLNGDRLIDSRDIIGGMGLGYEYKYQDLNGDGVIDEKDAINGSLQKEDNQIEVKIYIGM